MLGLTRLAEVVVDGFAAEGADGFLVTVGPAMREVLAELMVLLELVAGVFRVAETDGFLVMGAAIR